MNNNKFATTDASSNIIDSQIVEGGQGIDSTVVASSTTQEVTTQIHSQESIHTGKNSFQSQNYIVNPTQLNTLSLLNRKLLIGSYSWSSTGFSADHSASSLFEMWLAVASVSSKLSGYKNFKGECVYTITVSSSSGAFGKMVADIFPNLKGASATRPPFIGINNAFIGSHLQSPLRIEIDASKSATYSVDLGFVCVDDMCSIATYRDFWVNFFVVNPLRTALGTTPEVVMLQEYVEYKSIQVNTLINTGPELSNPLLKERASYYVQLASKISGVIPILTPFTKLLESGAELLKFAGYSKPEMEVRSMFIQDYNTRHAPVSGVLSKSKKIALDPGVCADVSINKHPFPHLHEDSLYAIVSKKGLVASDVQGSNAFRAVPNVVGSAYLATNTGLLHNAFDTTPLYFCSQLFNDYCGSIQYTIEFVSHPLIVAHFIIFTVPPNTTYTGISTNSTLEMIHVYVTGGTTIVSINVGTYTNNAFVPIVRDAISPYESGTTSIYPSILIQEVSVTCNGNPSITHIPYNVYISAGEGFSYGSFNPSKYIGSTVPISRYSYNEGPNGSEGINRYYQGLTSIKQIQKISDVLYSTPAQSTIITDPVLNLPKIPIYPAVSNLIGFPGRQLVCSQMNWVPLTYLQQMYLTHRGSINYTIHVIGETSGLTVMRSIPSEGIGLFNLSDLTVYNPPNTTERPFVGGLIELFDVKEGCAKEIVAVQATPKLYYINNGQPSGFGEVISLRTSADSVMVFGSAAEDYTNGAYWMSPPQMFRSSGLFRSNTNIERTSFQIAYDDYRYAVQNDLPIPFDFRVEGDNEYL